MGNAHGLFLHSEYNTKHAPSCFSITNIYIKNIFIYFQMHCHTHNFENPQRRHKKNAFLWKKCIRFTLYYDKNIFYIVLILLPSCLSS